ncbi:MAG TPA: zinc-finger domain-containing protein [Stellaceae bacterium]|nr:zinc-finger domain-containing protein [Stellaceae bacterium]
MQPFETIEVDQPIVACDGGGGVGGHPRVYLNLSGSGSVECPYCSRLFVRRGAAAGRPPGAEPGAPAKP